MTKTSSENRDCGALVSFESKKSKNESEPVISSTKHSSFLEANDEGVQAKCSRTVPPTALNTQSYEKNVNDTMAGFLDLRDRRLADYIQ